MVFKEITVQRISAGTLFKLAGLGLAFTLIPFSTLMGCFALFGASTVTWNQQPLTGVAGLLASPFIGIFLAGLFTIFLGSCMSIGLWLYSGFRPLTLRVKVSGTDRMAVSGRECGGQNPSSDKTRLTTVAPEPPNQGFLEIRGHAAAR
jgi:hypothetical protein